MGLQFSITIQLENLLLDLNLILLLDLQSLHTLFVVCWLRVKCEKPLLNYK